MLVPSLLLYEPLFFFCKSFNRWCRELSSLPSFFFSPPMHTHMQMVNTFPWKVKDSSMKLFSGKRLTALPHPCVRNALATEFLNKCMCVGAGWHLLPCFFMNMVLAALFSMALTLIDEHYTFSEKSYWIGPSGDLHWSAGHMPKMNLTWSENFSVKNSIHELRQELWEYYSWT